MLDTVRTSRSIRSKWAVASVAVATLSLSPFVAAPAIAADTSTVSETAAQTPPTYTADQIRQAHADLQAAGIPFDAVEDAKGVVNVYHFPEGDFGLRIPSEPGTLTPMVGVGSDGDGQYISLNHTDQIAIKTGATSALIIAIGALNPVAGGIAGYIAAVAGTYVNDRGACSGNDELWIYYTDGPTGPTYSQVVCRPVDYPGGG